MGNTTGATFTLHDQQLAGAMNVLQETAAKHGVLPKIETSNNKTAKELDEEEKQRKVNRLVWSSLDQMWLIDSFKKLQEGLFHRLLRFSLDNSNENVPSCF